MGGTKILWDGELIAGAKWRDKYKYPGGTNGYGGSGAEAGGGGGFYSDGGDGSRQRVVEAF